MSAAGDDQWPSAAVGLEESKLPYWVYGTDRDSGEPAEFFSDASTEEAAREGARGQGIEAERVEVFAGVREIEWQQGDVLQRARGSTQPKGLTGNSGSATGFAWIVLTVAQTVSILGCVWAVLAFVAAVFSIPDGLLVALAAFCGFCYSAAMLLVFSHTKARLHARSR